MHEELTLNVENFGPIAEASVKIKPLTIFVGQNNTGKSYLALLVYAISHSVHNALESADLPLYPYEYGLRHSRDPLTVHVLSKVRALNALKQWLPADTMMKRRIRPQQVIIPYNSLPKSLRQVADSHVEAYLEVCRKNLSNELRRCYGAKLLSDLACKTGDRRDFCLSIEQVWPELDLQFNFAGQELKLLRSSFSCRRQKLDFTMPSRSMFLRRLRRGGTLDFQEQGSEKDLEIMMLRSMAARIVDETPRQFMKILTRKAFYLPAARSGILQGQKVLSNSLMQAASYAGIEQIKMSRFSGVVVDFLSAIDSIEKSQHGSFYKLATQFEQELMAGTVELDVDRYQRPEIYFKEPKVGRLGLHRTSSMISELAPVILLLKYLLDNRSIIIVEEPESHLHPANQRLLAKLLARLVNAGVIVILTTHSDYFLQQMSNLVALGTKSASHIEKMGYGAQDVIHPDKVSAYLFESSKPPRGSRVRSLDVGDHGILDEEFGEVAEALYEETVESRRRA